MMQDYLLILLAGALGGFCSSAPLGAINLWITDAILAKAEEGLRWFIAGVIVADMAHATLAAWGYHALLDDHRIDEGLTLLGGVFLITMGISAIKKRNADREPHVNPDVKKPAKPLKRFVMGLFMCAVNPAFLVFWMLVIDAIESRLSVVLAGGTLLAFLIGIAFGDRLWFLTLTGVARRGREMVPPRTLGHIRLAIALAFIGVGAAAITKAVI